MAATATDNVSVASVVFTINGHPRPRISHPPYTMEVVAPSGTSVTITAVATDNLDQSATATSLIPIIDEAFGVTITSPAERTILREGEIITAAAAASGDVSTVVFTFDGSSLAPLTESPYMVEHQLPVSTSPPESPSSPQRPTAPW